MNKTNKKQVSINVHAKGGLLVVADGVKYWIKAAYAETLNSRKFAIGYEMPKLEEQTLGNCSKCNDRQILVNEKCEDCTSSIFGQIEMKEKV